MLSVNWKDCGTYFLNLSPQHSPDWFSQRIGRLTASNFAYAIKNSRFKTIEETALIVAGIDAQFSESAKAAMAHGTKKEPEARDWYCSTYKVEVEELGLAVPKWDNRIGASVDGNVIGTDGIIEIKCPLKMYGPLMKRTQEVSSGKIFDKYDHSHIWDGHYCQMQGCMAILGKKWCDYIVYATESQNVYVERIPFNEDFWNQELYPGINTFFRDYYPAAVEEVQKRKAENTIFTAVV